MSEKLCIKCGKIMEEDHNIDQSEGLLYGYNWECECGVVFSCDEKGKEPQWYNENDEEIDILK